MNVLNNSSNINTDTSRVWSGAFIYFLLMLGFMPFLQFGVPFSFFKFTLSDLFLFTFSLFCIYSFRIEKKFFILPLGAAIFFVGTTMSIIKVINLNNYIFSHLPWIYAMLLMMATGVVFRKHQYRRLRIVKNLLLGILVLSIVPVYLEFFAGFYFANMHFIGDRYMFFMLNPNQYMAFVIVALFVLTLYGVKYKPNKQLEVVLISLLCLLPILASGSRTGMVGVLGVLLINLSIFFFHVGPMMKGIFVGVIFFIIPIFIAFIEELSKESWLFARAFSVFRLFKGEDKVEDVAADSGHSIEYGLELFSENPLFGIGLGNFIEYNQHEVHNTFVAILTETGVVGFSLFLVFWMMIFYHIFKSKNKILVKYAVCVVVALYLVMNIPHILIRERWIWMFFSLMIVIVNTNKINVRNSRKRKLPI